MKTQKFPSCRSAQDLNADEMKQAAETLIQASDSSNETDSKSGTGTTGPGVTKPEDERELQAKACEGKKQYDPCSWNANGSNHTGVCNYSHGDKTYYCSYVPSTGIGSGTGGLSAKQAACLNKNVGDFCQYRDKHDMVQSGVCVRDIMDTSAQPLHCSN
ncbi:MAG: hypothetical protein J6L79_07850 [Muribaculaceae bacterium]|nr:hypothetical protein [Muribaculaceae bacterium]